MGASVTNYYHCMSRCLYVPILWHTNVLLCRVTTEKEYAATCMGIRIILCPAAFTFLVGFLLRKLGESRNSLRTKSSLWRHVFATTHGWNPWTSFDPPTWMSWDRISRRMMSVGVSSKKKPLSFLERNFASRYEPSHILHLNIRDLIYGWQDLTGKIQKGF